MSLKDDLIAARALIDTPEKWCKGRLHEGGFHGFDRHCSAGAIMAQATPGDLDQLGAMGCALVAALPKPFKRLPAFNDATKTTHADIMALFDRAIEAAE